MLTEMEATGSTAGDCSILWQQRRGTHGHRWCCVSSSGPKATMTTKIVVVCVCQCLRHVAVRRRGIVAPYQTGSGRRARQVETRFAAGRAASEDRGAAERCAHFFLQNKSILPLNSELTGVCRAAMLEAPRVKCNHSRVSSE